MSSVRRASAGLKLGVSLALILGLAALPARHSLWGLWALPGLLLLAIFLRVQLRAIFWRFALALPFLLGVASLSLCQPQGLGQALGLLTKSAVSLFILQLLVSTTKVSELLATLRRLHVPELLCEALALLSRYSSLLGDEARRMRRARAGRTLRVSRVGLWLALGNSIGLLFVRTVARAERVQVAMRSRGGA